MASTEGLWRLKLIAGMVLILTVLYSAYGLFNSDAISDTVGIDYTPSDGDINTSSKLNEDYDYNAEGGQDFISLIGGIGEFLTFGDIDNTFVRLMFNLFTTINFICIGYIVYSFIRDWVPFV